MKKNKKAFSLVEVMVVIIILSILASIALPRLQVAVERARSGEALQVLPTVMSAQRIFYLETGTWPSNITELTDINLPPMKNFTTPTLSGGTVTLQNLQGCYRFIQTDTGGDTFTALQCVNGPTTCNVTCVKIGH